MSLFTNPAITKPILYAFPFGSVVYGTTTDQSDKDYIVVVEGNAPYYQLIEENSGHIHVYSDTSFQSMINEHDITALECIFSQSTHYAFPLDLPTLRRSISAVVSNSFTKCRKKLEPGEHYDPYGAKKSLFHSLRILEFGIQIARYGAIKNFHSMNYVFEEIMKTESTDFEDYRKRFEPLGKELKEEFKQIAPLEKDQRKQKKGW